MKWNRKFIAKSLAALLVASLGAAACGDSAGGDSADSNNGAANNGTSNNANNGQSIEHPNLACSDIDAGTLCNITGTITEDLTLANDGTIFQLQGPVFVGDDTSETVLTIEPGVTVVADPATTETTFLTVRRNAKLMAEGTKDAPVVFTPAAEEGTRQRGMWGGLIINGNAPLNTGSEAEGEGNTGKYGGDDPDDSSGTLKYVRVEFAGDLITSENELNGIAFQGVGRGTVIDYVQVHMNSDDGVEFFGGTAEAKHLVLTGIGDDSIDWADGWQGKIQFAVVEQYDDKADRGIEADNVSDNPDATPRSQPTLSNITLIGGDEGDTGVLIRRGSAGNFYNFIVTDFASACIDLDDPATYESGWDASADDYSGELTMVNSIIDGCATAFDEDDEGDGANDEPFTVQEWFEAQAGNQQTDPELDGYTPQSGSPAMADSVQPEGDSFFEQVDFIGGVGSEDWTAGWTIHAEK
jgi:hypothetical protein